MQALLEATQGSCGVTEQACQIVLIGVSGFVQRNQGIGFGGAILPGVVCVDEGVDQNDAREKAGMEGNASRNEKSQGSCGEDGRGAGRFLAGVDGDTSGTQTGDKKSGQVLVRTLEGEKPSQMRLGCKSCTAISRGGRAGCGRGREEGERLWVGVGWEKREGRCEWDASGERGCVGGVGGGGGGMGR